MIIDGDRLWELLRSLDDPAHLEFPADYDHARAGSRFDQLVDRLGPGPGRIYGYFSLATKARHAPGVNWTTVRSCFPSCLVSRTRISVRVPPTSTQLPPLGHGGHHLDGDIRKARHRHQVIHLARHDLGGPNLAIQRQLIDQEPHGRGIIAAQYVLLPLHPGTEAGSDDLGGYTGERFEQAAGIRFGLDKAVKLSRLW